ncbi:MAG: hypothetical protein ABSF03_26990 [Streptosporangiaceae bacterium]
MRTTNFILHQRTKPSQTPGTARGSGIVMLFAMAGQSSTPASE